MSSEIRSLPSAGTTGVGTKFTVTLAVVVPGESISLPEVAFDPLHPLNAVHAVAFVDVQESVEVALPAPGVTLIGFAVRVTVGSGCGVTFTVTLALVVPFTPPQESA